MRARCRDPKLKCYKNYGGRGLKVDAAWDDFAQFVADMEPSWKPGLTLDRKDNDGDYSATNCRWITRKEQNQNHRRNRVYLHQGRVQNLKQWSIELGINDTTLEYQIRPEGKLAHLFKSVKLPVGGTTSAVNDKIRSVNVK